jgi:hypothetical protein
MTNFESIWPEAKDLLHMFCMFTDRVEKCIVKNEKSLTWTEYSPVGQASLGPTRVKSGAYYSEEKKHYFFSRKRKDKQMRTFPKGKNTASAKKSQKALISKGPYSYY